MIPFSHMATKKTVKKTVRRVSRPVIKQIVESPISSPAESPIASTTSFFQKLIIVILIGIAAFLLVKKFGKYVIVATVNNTPVTRWQLNNVLAERYGEATTEEIINRQLLQQLAKKENISISKEELEKELASIKEQLGDVSVTDSQLRDSANIKLLVTKIADKKLDLSITDEEVSEYYTDNKTYFEKQKLEDVKEDIKETLKQLKLQQKFSEWFKAEREKAKILILK